MSSHTVSYHVSNRSTSYSIISCFIVSQYIRTSPQYIALYTILYLTFPFYYLYLILLFRSDEDDDEENDAKDFIAKDEDARYVL